MIEILQHLMNGFANVMHPGVLLGAFFGGAMGVIVGALPGLGSAAGCALLLPLTFRMDPTTAIVTLCALYYGNMFGGGISAILINIPGDSPAVMTALDGYPLTKQGKPGKALFISFAASAMGGMIGAVILTMLGEMLANIGLAFGPPEIAMLIFLAMTSIGWVLGESPVKGLVSTFIGLLLASIGQDIVTGNPRMTFGSLNLFGGLSFIPIVIGLFGFSQIIGNIINMDTAEKQQIAIAVDKIRLRDSLPSRKDWIRIIPSTLRSSVLGFFIGLLPGSGATMAASLSYISEQRITKYKDEMGNGAVNGLAASESANNAASIGSFAPLLSLGIPGSATSAILLGGLMMWGLQPGPLFMTQNPEFSWSLIASMYVGDLMIAIMCILAIPILVNILKVPLKVLTPIIVVVSIVGAYSVNQNIFDILVMMVGGFAGHFMLKYKYPLAPLVLTLVLGPTFETSIRQSFLISSGSAAIFFTRPLSLALFVIAVLLVLVPGIAKSIKKKMKANG